MLRRGGKTLLGVRAPLDLEPSDCRTLKSPEMRALEEFGSRVRKDVVPAIRLALVELQLEKQLPDNPLHYLKVKLGFRSAPEDFVEWVREAISVEQEKRFRLLGEIVALRARLNQLEIERRERRDTREPEGTVLSTHRKGSPAFQAKWDSFFEPQMH